MLSAEIGQLAQRWQPSRIHDETISPGATMTQYPPPGGPDSTPETEPLGTGPYGARPPPGSWPPPPDAGTPWGPPVQQPGVVPLRPLTLGDIFGGAFTTVRRNPKATVGLAALVTFAFMLVPILATLMMGLTGTMPTLSFSSDGSGSLQTGDVGLWAAGAISAVFSSLSSIVVGGLTVRVVEGALVGEMVSVGTAWQRSRRRLIPLLGLTTLVFVAMLLLLAVPSGLGVAVGLALSSPALAIGLGAIGFLSGLAGCVLFYTRYVLLAAPCLVLEGHSVLRSFSRAGQLARGQFWRLFGIYLLAVVTTGFISQVITIPFSVAGGVAAVVLPGAWALAGTLLSTNIASVLTGALVGPFTASVMALQYYDQRFRKEGLDITLLQTSPRASQSQGQQPGLR